MHLVNVLLVASIAFIEFVRPQNIRFVASDENTTANEDHLSTSDFLDEHTFVALIDIVFTDNSKRTCTGSIIHDNVVITAAHCFVKKNNPDIKPELTASLVVIGTKKMFDAGYEQYLPIERVLTHPRFRGWTADLSLVYTFATMTSDKPGTIIPLAGEKTSTHVDSNVTVLSWGNMQNEDNEWSGSKAENKDIPCSTSIEAKEKDYNHHYYNNNNNKEKYTAMLQSNMQHRSNNYFSTPRQYIYDRQEEFKKQNSQEQNRMRQKTRARLQTKLISRYLSGEERVAPIREHRHRHGSKPKQTYYSSSTPEPNQTIQSEEEILDAAEDISPLSQAESNRDIANHNHSVPHSELYNVKSYYKNWRRYMGSEQNKLTVEIFGFVNVQACKLIVQKAMPDRYDISEGNDVVCYAAENLFISDADSGAPAIRRGQLIAVTVGGAESDGDHVAIGMKMSCYCSWIADNLPNSGDHLNCCNNCCDVKHKDFHDNTQKHKDKIYKLKSNSKN